MSPGASSLDLSRAASHQQSPPQMFPDDGNFDQNRGARHWKWNGIENGGDTGGGGGLGVGYFTTPHHDASMGLDLESIEQRGEILAAPDSGVRS